MVIEFKYMSKISDLIWKDVTGENESNRVSFIVRINACLMCFYYMVLMVVFGTYGRLGTVATCGMCFLAFAMAVYLTYKDHNTMALIIYSVITIFWMMRFVMQWGWECSIQHFVFVLLLLVFVGTYASETVKLFLSFGVIAIRTILYSWHVNVPPTEELPYNITLLFQIINILTIFTSMIVILSIFTRDKMATEAKLSQYNKKLKIISEHDPLTKLPNRRSVISGTISNIMRGVCPNGVCIAIGDIDFFKKVNDTYGHEAGDEVLKQLAVLCSEYMSSHGIAARWGGEEFLFVFNNENLDEAGMNANELLSKIRNMTVKWNDIEIKVTMTIGVADVNTFISGEVTEAEIDDRINEAVSAADKKLYMGKSNGRNTVVV